MGESDMVTIYRNGEALGDNLFAALLTQILVDNGIAAQFWHYDESMRNLMTCPIATSFQEPTHLCTYAPESTWDGRSILRKIVDNCQRELGLRTPLRITRATPPVTYYDIPEIEKVNVVLGTASGAWSPYRNWPYFDILKDQLTPAGITWKDITTTRGVACLNWAKKADLYVGLETGTSHYVATVINRGLVLQSGYSNRQYWNWYGYRSIEEPVECGNCFLQSGCPNNHKCMVNISVERVFDVIVEMLNE